jgi:hypothetical protein
LFGGFESPFYIIDFNLWDIESQAGGKLGLDWVWIGFAFFVV